MFWRVLVQNKLLTILIRHNARLIGDVRIEDRHDGFRLPVLNDHAAAFAATVN